MVFGLFKHRVPPPPPASKMPPFEQLYVFAAMLAALLVLLALQRPGAKRTVPLWLPPAGNTLMGEKREYEVWVLKYSVVWMAAMGVVIVTQVYESFTAATYFLFCGGLAAPLVLRELTRGAGPRPRPFGARHGVRAQLWIAIFGFIGNYWYTHYFYCVLRARYTMPSWRLNDVPIGLSLPLIHPHPFRHPTPTTCQPVHHRRCSPSPRPLAECRRPVAASPTPPSLPCQPCTLPHTSTFRRITSSPTCSCGAC